MPWVTDDNGDEKYLVSKYTIEQLPTWYEIHEEFLKNKWFTYDENDKSQQTLDSYWKRPHRLVLLEFMVNQFNKMLHEDGDLENTINFISGLSDSYYSLDNLNDIEFNIIKENSTHELQIQLIYSNDHPNVYITSDIIDFNLIIEFILRDVIRYYQDPIGFKDDNGFLIDGYNDPNNNRLIDNML